MKFELPPDDKGGKNEPATPESLSQQKISAGLEEQTHVTIEHEESREERASKIGKIQSDLSQTGPIESQIGSEVIATPELFVKPTLNNFGALTKNIDGFFTEFERNNNPIDITDGNFWETLERETGHIAKTLHGRYPVFYYDRPETNSRGKVSYPQNKLPFTRSPVLGDDTVFMEIMVRDSFNQLVKNKLIDPVVFESYRNSLFIPISERKFVNEYTKEDKKEIIKAQREAWKKVLEKYSKKEILRTMGERESALYAVYALGTDKEQFIDNPDLITDARLRTASVAYRNANAKQENVWDHETPKVSLKPSLAYLKRFYFF